MTSTPNGFTLDDALAFVRKASPEERTRLAEAVYSYCMSDVQHAKVELSCGDLVVFEPKRRNCPTHIHGMVTAINQKTVTIRPINGGRSWRVRADLVRKSEPAAL